MNFQEFIKKYDNKSVDVDGIYGSQCVDLIKRYTQEVFGVTLGTFGGSAKTGWYNGSNTFPEDQWEQIDNDFDDINQLPEEGDIVFWGYGSYGHCAIYMTDTDYNTFDVFNQNTGNGDGYGYDDRSRIENQDFNGMLGWYRFKKPVDTDSEKFIDRGYIKDPQETNGVSEKFLYTVLERVLQRNNLK